jgi:methionyl-tRNA formyltransferase
MLKSMADGTLRIAFAGDRDIAVNVLAFLVERGERPLALILPDAGCATHDAALLQLCESTGAMPLVLRANQLTSAASIEALHGLRLDYLLSVHFPYLIQRSVLDTAKKGALNLHPAYLPYNRGWHTPSWAILEDTPAGASLHFMTEALDSGAIVHQAQIAIDPSDTAHTLYLKLKELELRVFAEGWQRICDGRAASTEQPGHGTVHRRADLFEPAVQKLELDEVVRASDLLRRLRALTTSRLDEAAYFDAGSRRYRVQITITPEADA